MVTDNRVLHLLDGSHRDALAQSLVDFAAKRTDSIPKERVDALLNGSITSYSGLSYATVDADGNVNSAQHGTIPTRGNFDIKADTPLRINSTTKMFLALTALKMADEEQLDLNKSLHQHATEWGKSLETLYGKQESEKFIRLIQDFTAKDATLDDLFTHRSGIGNGHHYQGQPDITPSGREAGALQHLFIDETSQKKPSRNEPPFQVSHYSNTGYILAGLILQAESFERSLREHNGNIEEAKRKFRNTEDLIDGYVCKPLHLTNTYFSDELKAVYEAQRARAEGAQPEAPKQQEGNRFSRGIDGTDMAGGIMTTPEDHLKILAGLREYMQTGRNKDKLLPKEGEEYTFGLIWTKINGEPYFGHTGGDGGGQECKTFMNFETGSGFSQLSASTPPYNINYAVESAIRNHGLSKEQADTLYAEVENEMLKILEKEGRITRYLEGTMDYKNFLSRAAVVEGEGKYRFPGADKKYEIAERIAQKIAEGAVLSSTPSLEVASGSVQASSPARGAAKGIK